MNPSSYCFKRFTNYGFTENRESHVIHNYVSTFTRVPVHDGKKYPTLRKIHSPTMLT